MYKIGGDHVLHLNKNLYGLQQGGYNFWIKLRDHLLSDGFQQSSSDPCVFLKKGLIVVSYVDDCLIFAPNKKDIDAFIKTLTNAKFQCTDEGDVAPEGDMRRECFMLRHQEYGVEYEASV